MNLFRYLALPLLICTPVMAIDLELSAVFSDHMVVQRDQPMKIRGWADPDSTIACTFADNTTSATAGADGKWNASLQPPAAGGPYEITVKSGEQSIVISDVLVGEVWLCSGQSNMAMTVNRALNFEQEIANANTPRIRMFKESSPHSSKLQDKCRGTWSVCSPETVGSFSATAYFFGRQLHHELDVPVGLINSSVGGTAVEAWTSLSAQESTESLAPVLKSWKKLDSDFDADLAQEKYQAALKQWEKRRATARAAGNKPPRKPVPATRPSADRNYPSNLFNSKIHPLVGYGIRGAIWYQGERNANGRLSHLYGQQLQTLIRDWRDRWGQGEFPFAWVQLPNYRQLQTQPSETSGWVQVREGMLQTLRVPHTGMAITVDVGQANDIHPKNKQAVGRRLAQWALLSVYNHTRQRSDETQPMGPIFDSSEKTEQRIRVGFQYVGTGLKSEGGSLKGFAIAGSDHVFHWASARILGDQVEVWSEHVNDPMAVRYSWAANPLGNLYNSSGLPASPFRTDDWSE